MLIVLALPARGPLTLTVSRTTAAGSGSGKTGSERRVEITTCDEVSVAERRGALMTNGPAICRSYSVRNDRFFFVSLC